MSIEVTSDKAVALYDSVTGIAFGPVFEGWEDFSPSDEADAFVRWYEQRGDLRWLSQRGASIQKPRVDEWHKLLVEHTEEFCPWDKDRDSYGIGYTGDSDRSYGDYTAAVPDMCPCTCHRQPGARFSGR